MVEQKAQKVPFVGLAGDHQSTLPAIWRTLILVTGIAVIGSNSLVLSPIITDVALDLGTSASRVAHAAAAYGGATALSALALASLIDRFGAGTVLPWGAVVLGLGIFSSAAAQTWWQLCMTQAVAGLASGVMIPAIYATATGVGGAEGGARTLGHVLTGWSLSMVAGVPAAAALAGAFGWRATYIALGGLVVLSLIGFATLRSSPSQTTRPSKGGPRQALAVPGVPLLLAVQFLFMVGFYGVYPFFGHYMRTDLDLSASEAGLVILVYGIGFGLVMFADSFIDHFDPRQALVVALVGGCVVYTAMDHFGTSFAGVLAVALVWGCMNHVIINLLVLDLSRRGGALRGSVLGLNSAVTYLGSMIGPLAFGVLYAAQNFSNLILAALFFMGAAVVVRAAAR